MNAGPKPHAVTLSGLELIFALNSSSGSWLRRVFPIHDHSLCRWLRLQLVEAELKPPFGPRRSIAVPEVVHRLLRVGAPLAHGLANITHRFSVYRGCHTSQEIGRATNQSPAPFVVTTPAACDGSSTAAGCAFGIGAGAPLVVLCC